MRDVLDSLDRMEVLSAALEVAFDAETNRHDWGFVVHLEHMLSNIWSE
jgi:hypothetical protein